MAFDTITGTPKLRQILLDRNEDHFTDFKSKDIKPAKLQETFVAFANTDGGELFVGLEDKKFIGNRFNGFKMPEDANDIIDTLFTKTDPSVEGIDVEYFDFGSDGLILHFTIPKSPHVHYTADKSCHIRLNASTKGIKGDKVTQLSYSKGSISYERNKVSHLDVQDILASPVLLDYLERINTDLTPQQFLRKQRLILNEKGEWIPTVACILMFDEAPQSTLDTRCAIKLYRLRTTDSEYKREHLEGLPLTIEGCVEKQIYNVISAVNSMLEKVIVQIDGKLIEVNYPADAIRELIINAILHRDYSINDDIHIRIYDNRIEIVSPGRLPGHITPQNILNERVSRNPNIVRLLHQLPNPVNFDIGEGLNTAFTAMNRAGLENPLIDEQSQAVIVTIAHKKIASLETIILEFLDENETIANRDVRLISGEASENKVKKAFQRLRADGQIEPVNPDAKSFEFRYRKVK